jgi:hypothetical protein
MPLAGADTMIFVNPKGAPELACNECGCRWFDRMTNTCYECGARVAEEDIAEFQAALQAFVQKRSNPPSQALPETSAGGERSASDASN